MTYEITDTPPPISTRKWKYQQIELLEIGQGFRVPYSDLSEVSGDPAKTVTVTVSKYAKKTGKKFSTKRDAIGVWIVRKE